MGRITITDIAKACGTSKATVSYVINGKVNKVSPELARKIEQTMKDMGYVPSLSAKSLAGKGSKLIGVIIPQVDVTQKMVFDNPFYSEFLSGTEYYLRKAGYGVVLGVLSRENSFEDTMMRWNLDGAVVFGIDNDSMLKLLGNYKVPVLLIDSYITPGSYHCMNLKDEEASYMATRRLLDEGEREVALVTGKMNQSILLTKRFEGYQRALEEYGLPFRQEYVYEGDVTYEYGMEAAGAILSQKGIDGIVATADILAFGIMNQLQNSGCRIPEDYAIIGFDDTYQSKIMYPKLTTVGQNISKRGEKAGELILNIIDGVEVEKDILMDFNIMERDTTKKKKKI